MNKYCLLIFIPYPVIYDRGGFTSEELSFSFVIHERRNYEKLIVSGRFLVGFDRSIVYAFASLCQPLAPVDLWDFSEDVVGSLWELLGIKI